MVKGESSETFFKESSSVSSLCVWHMLIDYIKMTFKIEFAGRL